MGEGKDKTYAPTGSATIALRDNKHRVTRIDFKLDGPTPICDSKLKKEITITKVPIKIFYPKLLLWGKAWTHSFYNYTITVRDKDCE